MHVGRNFLIKICVVHLKKESFSLKSKVLWVLAALQPLNIKRSKCTHLTTRGALQWMQTFVKIIKSILAILNTIKVVLFLFCEIWWPISKTNSYLATYIKYMKYYQIRRMALIDIYGRICCQPRTCFDVIFLYLGFCLILWSRTTTHFGDNILSLVKNTCCFCTNKQYNVFEI